MPLRDETMSPFARAHSRTRHASASAAISRMCGVELGEPISSSGLAMNVSRSNGSAAALVDERLERVAARRAGPTSCRSRPGRRRCRRVDRERAARRPCPDRRRCPCGRSGGPAGRRRPRRVNVADDRVAEASGRVRPALDRRAETARNSATPRGRPVDALGGVPAAVDVDEPREVVEVRGQRRRRDRRLERVELDRREAVAGAAVRRTSMRRAV